MLFRSCVNTPIDCIVFHNLHMHVARCSASCENGRGPKSLEVNPLCPRTFVDKSRTFLEVHCFAVWRWQMGFFMRLYLRWYPVPAKISENHFHQLAYEKTTPGIIMVCHLRKRRDAPPLKTLHREVVEDMKILGSVDPVTSSCVISQLETLVATSSCHKFWSPLTPKSGPNSLDEFHILTNFE